MAFLIPAIAAGAVLLGVGGGTAVGLAVTLRKRMKHTETSVIHLMNLTEGDHISLKKKGKLPFSHAIVVGRPQNHDDKVKVIYHTGSKATARVEYAEVDLHEQTKKGEVIRHQYEVLICFPAQAVVARAVSLCSHSQYNSSDRREIIRSYWPFFRDDEHFANWCQIGFSFRDSAKATFATDADYTRTLVSDMTHLNEGDHVSTHILSAANLTYFIFCRLCIILCTAAVVNRKYIA